MASPSVSVVLGSYNRREFLKATLESIRTNGMDFPYEIIVVDGGSTDGSLKYLAAQRDVITIIQHNRGEWRGKKIERRSWGYFMNLGFKTAQGKYVCMISDDCLLIPGAIKNGVQQFEKLLVDGRKVGAMAFYWREWPGNEQYWVGKTFGKIFVNHGLYLRKAVAVMDGFDEEIYHFYHADGDLCLRMWQAGYEVVDCPKAYVEHFAHANLQVRKSNSKNQKADWEAYLQRWGHLQCIPGDASILINYTDPYHTYRNFPWIARIWSVLKQFVRLLFRQKISKTKP